MKNFILSIFALCFMSFGYSQKKSIDTANVVFKAKLMTMYRQGVTDSTLILETVLSQKVEFIENPSEKITLMKIPFSQTIYRNSKYTSSPFFGACSYYIAFSTKRDKFYRIGGFDTNDVVEFIDDIKTFSDVDDALFLNSYYRRFDEFDIDCLLEYYELSEKKRKKEGFNCFNTCSKKVFTEWKNTPDSRPKSDN